MTARSPLLVPESILDEQNPWPGLRAFDESAQRFFNGRREESAVLRRLVTNAPLTVLFGASGLGKTSLVRAGLFPLLRKDVLPVYVRLDFSDREGPLLDQVKTALQAEIAHSKVDAPAVLPEESLWAYLHRSDLEFWSRQNQLLIPLFVFDQFEEVFTLGAPNIPGVGRLRTDLADLIENRVPDGLAARLEHDDGLSLDSQRYKVLLSFREDFLAQIEGWKRDIPSIMRNRLRLLPMSSSQAFEAIHATAPHLAPEPIAQRIVNFVAAAGDSNAGGQDLTVEPALLSLVCHGLNERRKHRNKSQFDEELLTGTGQAIIADYYSSAVQGMPEAVQRFIERELITERGFRKPCDIDDARTLHGVTDRDLAILVDRRLLHIQPARGTERIELTHDLLTGVVREARDRQRQRERDLKERAARRRLVVIGAVFAAIAIIMGSISYYAFRQKDAADRQKELADQQKIAAENAEANARADKAKAEKATTQAETARLRAESQARAALGHQRAGSALAVLKDRQADPISRESARKDAIRFALEAVEATRPDNLVLPDAEDALRRAAYSQPGQLPRPGHLREVTRIQISPDGRKVATFAADHTSIWDVVLQEEIQRFGNCLDISPDWKRLLCNFHDLQDVETGKVLRSLPKPPTTFRNGLAIEHHFIHFAVGQNDDSVLWEDDWDLKTFLWNGHVERPFDGEFGVLSPDGKLLSAIVVGESVRIWNTASGKELYNWPGHAVAVRFSPSGRTLAIVAGQTDRNSQVTTAPRIVLWRFMEGRAIEVAPSTGGNLSCFDFSPDGSRVAALFQTRPSATSQESDGTFHLVDALSGVESMSWNTTVVSPFVPAWNTRVSSPFVAACKFTPDGKSLIVTGSTGRTRDGEPLVETRTEIWDLALSPPKLRMSENHAGVVAYDPTGTVRAASEKASVSVTNLVTKSTAEFPSECQEGIPAAVFSPDGKRLATSACDNRVRIWNLMGARQVTLIGHRQPVWNLAFSGDGRLLVSCSSQGEVKLWNAVTGQLMKDLQPGFSSQVYSVAFSPDGKRIVASGYKDRLAIFDRETGMDVSSTWREKPTSKVYAVGYSGDGRRLAIDNRQLSIFDTSTLKELQSIPGSITTAFDFSGLYSNRDGSSWAAAGSQAVRLWTSKGPWKTLQRSQDANSGLPYQLAFSRDGKRLVTPGLDNTVLIWDVARVGSDDKGQQATTLYYEAPERMRIKALTFSADERSIYAVGDDWTIFRFSVTLDDLITEAKEALRKKP